MENYPEIQISEVVENEDGTSTIMMHLTDEFKDWFKKEHNLKRWSEKRFAKWFVESLENHAIAEEISDE
jgi:hypothetical protein